MPDDGWIELPQGARVHREEIKMAFDESLKDPTTPERGIIITRGGNVLGRETGQQGSIDFPSWTFKHDTTHTHPAIHQYVQGPRDEATMLHPIEEGTFIRDMPSAIDMSNAVTLSRAKRVLSSGRYDNDAVVTEFTPPLDVEPRKAISQYIAGKISDDEVSSQLKDNTVEDVYYDEYKKTPASTYPSLRRAAPATARRIGGELRRIEMVKDDDGSIHVLKISSTKKEVPDYRVAAALPAPMKIKIPKMKLPLLRSIIR